jgi:hypothetical protein
MITIQIDLPETLVSKLAHLATPGQAETVVANTYVAFVRPAANEAAGKELNLFREDFWVRVVYLAIALPEVVYVDVTIMEQLKSTPELRNRIASYIAQSICGFHENHGLERVGVQVWVNTKDLNSGYAEIEPKAWPPRKRPLPS